MPEDDLCKIIGQYDGWIIGDDPATRKVLQHGCAGRLKACMRWALVPTTLIFLHLRFGIPIENTPGCLERIADLAMHYLTGLARNTFKSDEEVKETGTNQLAHPLVNKALIYGLGDIGKNLAKRLLAHDVEVHITILVSKSPIVNELQESNWPQGLSDVDFVIFTAPLGF